MRKYLKLALLLLLCGGLLAGCEADNPTAPLTNPLRLLGRLSFGDPQGCASAVTSQDTNWIQCHQFKRQFDPTTGDPITEPQMVANALRPLGAALELAVFRPANLNTPCGYARIQTNLTGSFDTLVSGCGTPDQNIVITGRALLQYQFFPSTGGAAHSVRAVWREDQALSLFPNFGPEVNHSYAFSRIDAGQTHRYAVPQLAFLVTVKEPVTQVSRPAELNLGNRVFLAKAADDSFSYMRQLLSAYTTMVELHNRIRDMVSAPGTDTRFNYFNHMFITEPASGWTNSYTLWFDNGWAFGWHGGIAMYRPDLERFRNDGSSWGVARLLSGVDTLSHEFGHSVHSAMAPLSFRNDYSFANIMRRAMGPSPDYDWGHGGGQYQEMGTAFTEGIANTIGQYTVNGCQGWVSSQRPLGGADPFSNNMWNADASCDATDGCSYHHLRWHLVNRGLVEGSTEWNRRVELVRGLTAAANMAGHRFVTSNSETRYGEFGCDVLDDDADVSHATGKVRGLSYLADFTYHVGEALDGRRSNPSLNTFDSDPVSETVHLSFPQFLDVMAGFCPGCQSLPAGGRWGSLYNWSRLSAAASQLSPQSFSKYMQGKGWASEEQVTGLLKSNFMEL